LRTPLSFTNHELSFHHAVPVRYPYQSPPSSHAHDSPLSYAHFCLFTCFPMPTWTVAVTRRLSASFVPSSIWFRITQHTLLYVHLNCNPKINGNIFDPVREDVSITDVIVVVKMTLSSSSLVRSIRCTYDPFTGRTLWPVLECHGSNP
jgi:hypothetical protein